MHYIISSTRKATKVTFPFLYLELDLGNARELFSGHKLLALDVEWSFYPLLFIINSGIRCHTHAKILAHSNNDDEKQWPDFIENTFCEHIQLKSNLFHCASTNTDANANQIYVHHK